MKKHMLHRIHELTIAIGTGMRKREQYGLLLPDVHFDRRIITVRDPKAGKWK